jgi:hypothetical protein
MRESPDCIVLCDLFSSPRGNVSAGRLIQGGRLALLREAPDPIPPELHRAVDRGRSLTHPKVLKVLGLATDGHRKFVASEYVPGVSLLELNAALRRQRLGLNAGAAVRLMLGALARVADTREQLVKLGEPPVRLLHGDCVWVAEFGESMLTEAVVSSRLGRVASPMPSAVDADDVRTAAIELFQLVSGRLMTGDIAAAMKQHLPPALANVLEAALAWDPSSDLDTPRGFIRALRGLPSALVGDEQAVVSELQRVVGDVLEERRRKLASPEPRPRDLDGPTRVYSVRDAEQARAEADESEEATAALPGQVRGLTLRPVEPALPLVVPGAAASQQRAPRPVLDAFQPVAPARRAYEAPNKGAWSTLERALLLVLVLLLLAVVVLAIRNHERVALLFGSVGVR